MGSPADLRRPRIAPILRAAARTGAADYLRSYSWRSWTFGWLLRCLAEVVFFGLIGVLLGSRSAALFLVVGRAFYLGTQEVMWVIQSSTWERRSGTLPLLVSAPGRVWPAFAGRSLQWLPSAWATSTIALLVVTPLFGQRLSAAVLLLVPLCTLIAVVSGYGFAFPIAALVLRRPAWRNFASNLTHSVAGLICGVFVPVAFWPVWVQSVAQAVPVTHSLQSLREGLGGGGTLTSVLGPLGVSLTIGAAWFAVGALLLERFAERARADGSIDLGE